MADCASHLLPYHSNLPPHECNLSHAQHVYGDYPRHVYIARTGECIVCEDMSAIRTAADILDYLNSHRRYGPEITYDDIRNLTDVLCLS